MATTIRATAPPVPGLPAPRTAPDALSPAGAPGWSLYLTEPSRAAADYGSYLAARPLLSRLPHGDGSPVLVLPGLLAGDGSTRPMRQVLRRLGYHVHGWQLGRNIGPTAACVDGLRARMDELADRYDQPVTLIGWSLGGIFARDIARRSPTSVRSVITLGSPFAIQHAGQTRASRVLDHYAGRHVEHTVLPLAGERDPLPVPATSIWSRMDGIVPWQACVERPGPTAENIAVHASHLGFGHHPAVLWAIADRLARPVGGWTPFTAPRWLRPAFPTTDLPTAAA